MKLKFGLFDLILLISIFIIYCTIMVLLFSIFTCCTVILKLINFISFPNKTKYQTHWPNQFSLIYRYCYLSFDTFFPLLPICNITYSHGTLHTLIFFCHQQKPIKKICTLHFNYAIARIFGPKNKIIKS